jgi:hypothetical protein
MIRKPEPGELVVGEDSSGPGVADFLLPRPFNDLNPGIGIVMNDWWGRGDESSEQGFEGRF